ncbi:MAG: hypothetical protein COZ49_04385 [Candidatus Yonathbacteria bacterium CG_4_10_14_3_um_filter_47_65]|uniref:Uncharacterized protein n=2 Tax=Parcubacteria group TaxID=1794811 RepID=A0A2M8D6C1_9BACT|nr:MAG: hypothetical protein AUJ44_04250 [Candidatus Nomurabacteria bacterium CG1_02_47_685]PIP03444.1 MAG: hypothetical protein COX54_03610 [Candidatus Yonathbacteria bacterium CG23_combo_of_CG06-09_8_20_14_all_46_18]PIQ31858.1 MAG: hypothetical protein COW61_03155 [Candidatus Yonathbacteria bacterium CG17_big_fil_post_rev_8_21_14_2_50_46_19]PIX56007.1 MAG: hypothetical protein COZ49_04385 [Candidatus Yonathbacteria bacterium CG_4_10_14_3_um_filter_47_65]PIY57393.1 MAG: hypothetical protein CO
MAINQEILKQYKNIDWDKLLRKDLGQTGELNEVKQNFDRIKSIFDKIISYEVLLNEVPNYQRAFEKAINNFINSCNSQILGNSYTNTADRQSKIAFIRSLEETLISQLSPVFNYFQFVDPTNKGKQEDLAKRLKDADTLINKLEKAVDVSSKIAQKQEVVEYGNAFDEMANKTNAIRARRNIIAMYISLAVTLFIALIFVWGKHLDIPDESFSLKLIWNTILDQNILLKLFMVSAGGYLVAHFSRNYSAEMNMYYTNKHRQLALNSHQRIIDSVIKTETPNDAETKNAILLQVAKTMFDIQETGYLKNGNNPVPTTQIVETVRTGITRE